MSDENGPDSDANRQESPPSPPVEVGWPTPRDLLAQRESNLRSILESAKDFAIISMDPRGVIHGWSAGAEAIFGFTAAEALGQPSDIIWLAEDLAAGEAEKERRTAVEKGWAPDNRWHRRKDGASFFARGALRPVYDATNGLAGFVKIARDETEHHLMEQALEEARGRLDLAMLAGDVRAFAWEVEADRFYADFHLVPMPGREPRPGSATPLSSFLADIITTDRDRVADAIHQTATAGANLEVEYRTHSHQPLRWFVARGKLEKVARGKTRVAGVIIDITDRKMAQEGLSRLAAIVESSDDAIVSKTLDGIVRTWNRGAEQVFGYKAEEMVGRPISVIIPDDRQDEEPKILQKLSQGARIEHFETVRRHKDGRLINISVTISPVYDASGKVVAAAKIARNISDQKRAEQATYLMAEQRRLALDAARLGWWHLDPARGEVIWDARLQEILGQPSDRMPYPRVLELVHQDDRQAVAQSVERAARSEPYAMEFRIVRPDGSIRWVRASGKSEFSGQGATGRLINSVGTVSDITDDRAVQNAMRESEARFRDLADAMPQIVWTAQPGGGVDYVNRRWYQYTGLPAGTIDKTLWARAAPPEELAGIERAWDYSLRTGLPYEYECRLRRASDRMYRWHLSRAVPIRNADGSVARWFGTSTDIHDQKLLQELNEHLLESERTARAEVERQGRMKDDFLATLSHELRTPLNAIVGWSQILRSGHADEAELAEGLAAIDRNARAQTQIIEDMLDMSRIISGKLRLDVQQLDLHNVVQAGVDTVRPAAEAKGVRITTVLDPIPEVIRGDPNRLQQVFWNLLSNAVKFTPKGGKVQVVLERVNSHAEVSVIDTGEGIRAEFLPYVFDRFRQGDASTTRKFGGLGLGLSIVKQLVEMHGGTVRVASAGVGSGSTFTVALPLTVVYPMPAPEPQREHPRRQFTSENQQKACGQLHGVKVLVVDDEFDARDVVRRLLEDCDAVVRTAASATEAIQLLQNDPPSVLVSDIGMPGVDGYTLIRQVRELPPAQGGDVPALALTAYARTSDRIKALEAGFQMHACKPVDPAELIVLVASLAKTKHVTSA